MFSHRRVLAVGGFLAVAAIVTCSHVWGEPGRDKDSNKDGSKPKQPTLVDGGYARFELNPAKTRFQDVPVSLYETTDGRLFGGIQLKPNLPDVTPRPRDIALL